MHVGQVCPGSDETPSSMPHTTLDDRDPVIACDPPTRGGATPWSGAVTQTISGRGWVMLEFWAQLSRAHQSDCSSDESELHYSRPWSEPRLSIDYAVRFYGGSREKPRPQPQRCSLCARPVVVSGWRLYLWPVSSDSATARWNGIGSHCHVHKHPV